LSGRRIERLEHARGDDACRCSSWLAALPEREHAFASRADQDLVRPR
jgi:hypothetical protein